MSQHPLIAVSCRLDEAADRLLAEGAAHCEISHEPSAISKAVIAFGQPDVQGILENPALRWVQVSSAGYTNYDTDEMRATLTARGATMTNSSWVFAEPCAQHAAAMMLGLARQLPQAHSDQANGVWHDSMRRRESFLLAGQRVALLGYGAIGTRLAEILMPFNLEITAFRRRPRGDEAVPVVTVSKLADAVAQADHVVNLLPESDATRGFVSRDLFASFKPGARYYAIGRGATTDQDALLDALNSSQLSAAYLDVTTPEPLPENHPLWTAPNCFITPHSAGGHAGEHIRLAEHFLRNLRAFESGEPLADRVI